MKIEKIKVSDLKPYENNAKIHTHEQVEQIKKSIQEFGFNDPIAVDENNMIVEGHGRLMAVKALGYTEVDCVRLDGMTDEQKRAYIHVHNQLTLNTGFDLGILEAELKSIESIDMGVFGFDMDFDIDTDFDDEANEDDFEAEVPEEPKAKLGDIYQLGRHRLMCGDSTDKETVEKLMNGTKADMVFTDPPYGMKKEADGVANDNLNYDDLLEFNKQWIPISFDALKENGSWYCWGIDEPLMDIYGHILKPMQKSNKITFRNLITWDKGNGQGQMSSDYRMFPIADEKCLFVMCGVQGFNNNTDNYFEGWEGIRSYLEAEAKKAGIRAKEVKEICGCGMYAHWFTKSQWMLLTEENYLKIQGYCKANGIEAFKREYDDLKREYYSTRAYFDNTHDNMNNVWHFNKLASGSAERAEAGGHATPKPIALCSRAIKSSSREGEIVLDVFGGSGSTLIACEQLYRSAHVMELEPKWVDVIIARWEKYTGEKAVLLNGNR